MWDGVLKCLLWFLLLSEVPKGLNFILAAATSRMIPKGQFGNFVFLLKLNTPLPHETIMFFNICLN
jgi:hypothetical protein